MNHHHEYNKVRESLQKIDKVHDQSKGITIPSP